jgi:hypothetical protein
MDYSTAVILNIQLESRQIFEDELSMFDFLHDSQFMSGPLDVAFSFLGGIGAGTKKGRIRMVIFSHLR